MKVKALSNRNSWSKILKTVNEKNHKITTSSPDYNNSMFKYMFTRWKRVFFWWEFFGGNFTSPLFLDSFLSIIYIEINSSFLTKFSLNNSIFKYLFTRWKRVVFGRHVTPPLFSDSFLPIIYMEKKFPFLTKFSLMFYNYVLINHISSF